VRVRTRAHSHSHSHSLSAVCECREKPHSQCQLTIQISASGGGREWSIYGRRARSAACKQEPHVLQARGKERHDRRQLQRVALGPHVLVLPSSGEICCHTNSFSPGRGVWTCPHEGGRQKRTRSAFAVPLPARPPALAACGV
jgi:hypothetical protein